MKFGGMIGHDPRNNRLVFGSDRVKGQGQGHEKVKNVYLRYFGQILSDLHKTRCPPKMPVIKGEWQLWSQLPFW